MYLEELLESINLKGGTIVSMDSNLARGDLKVNIIKRFDDFNLTDVGNELSPYEEVEVQIVFSGIRYICMDFEHEKGKVIIGTVFGKLDGNDIMMIKTFDTEYGIEEYNEFYIRGENVNAKWRIIKKVRQFEKC